MKVLAARFAVAAAMALAGAAPAAGDWTQFRLNGGNNAVVGGPLEASWRISTGDAFSSSPTYGGGAIYIGNNGGKLYAIDAASGRVLWRYSAGNPLMSAPLLYRGLVIDGEGNENSPPGSSPTHPFLVGDGTSALIAVDRRTGALRWQTKLDGSGMPTGAIVGGIFVHHDGSGTLVALDPSNGRIRYRRSLGPVASMSAALPVGNGEFVTNGIEPNAMLRVRVSDGSVVWRASLPGNSSGAGDCPAATDGRRVFCDYIVPAFAKPIHVYNRMIQRAYAVDIGTGAKLWDAEIARGNLPERNESGIPLVANGLLYIGSAIAPSLQALDPRTGRTKWRAKTRGPVKGGIASVNGVLYFGDFAGYLWAVNGATGAVAGERNMHTIFNVGSPLVVGRTLFIGSRGGSVIAVPLATIRSGRD